LKIPGRAEELRWAGANGFALAGNSMEAGEEERRLVQVLSPMICTGDVREKVL